LKKAKTAISSDSGGKKQKLRKFSQLSLLGVRAGVFQFPVKWIVTLIVFYISFFDINHFPRADEGQR